MSVKMAWSQYQVFDNESLQAIAIKFDTTVQTIKTKNKIRDSSDLWSGRTILVPSPDPAKMQKEINQNQEDDEDDPENVGFIKLDAFRLSLSADDVVNLAKVEMEKEVNGVLLITPSAIMFDPEISTNIKDGIILPMTDVKKAALYHINNNTSKAWFQVSGSSKVAYFGIESSETSPILRCLQKWSPAQIIKTRSETEIKNSKEDENKEFIFCSSTSEIDRNEEFFSSVETEWQMESGNFEPWTKLDHTELEPKLVSDLPEMSRKSFILIDDQAKQINSLLPPRCIGAQWVLKYSNRIHGTSLKTLYRQVHETDSPNLCIMKTYCGSVVGCLASHPLRPCENFFGSGETFLFQFPDFTSGLNFAQYSWSGLNSFFIRCDKDQIIFGSSEGNYAIWIEGSLQRGTSKTTKTFNNPILTKNKDFQIETFEVWSFSG